MVKEELR